MLVVRTNHLQLKFPTPQQKKAGGLNLIYWDLRSKEEMIVFAASSGAYFHKHP